MSKRNSQAAKTAARERLRIEREKQAKRARIRRQLLVALSVVVVIVVAGGIFLWVKQATKPSAWEAAKTAKLVKPANTSGKDGTTVIIGKASAKNTLKEYEDPRCPICAQFEQTVGSTVQQDVKSGKFKIQYVGATFIDTNDPGVGSKNALSALGAALNVSPDAFLQYKSALYSKTWHPDETTDKFKDDSYLLKVANTVPALKNNKSFQNNVKKGTFDRWAIEESKLFTNNKQNVTGTPSLFLNGKKLTDAGGQNAPMTVQDFNTAVDKVLGTKSK
jgi:protein-disulfide isomerase